MNKISEVIKIMLKTKIISEENYRRISITCYKILTSLLLERINMYIQDIVGNYQYGIWRGKSTTDHMSKYYEFGKDLHFLVFVNYKSRKLWKAQIILILSKKYLNLIKNVTKKTLYRVCYLQGI